MEGVPPFACCFMGNSYPIPASVFQQAGPAQWVLDVSTSVTPDYDSLKEICLFLTVPNVLDPSMAFGLYVKVGTSDWLYRGCVHALHPSEAMPLSWPSLGSLPLGPGVIQIGVSLEPTADLVQKEFAKLGAREDFAKRVAFNLFRYMESFGTNQSGDKIVVPMNALEKWFEKFQHRFRRDPDFLTRQDMPT